MASKIIRVEVLAKVRKEFEVLQDRRQQGKLKAKSRRPNDMAITITHVTEANAEDLLSQIARTS